jgi:hypothetical protein
MIIPITVVLCPFLDTWITGPEKDIMKRPVILMTCVMAIISWVLFSLLIIANVANIHTDPPYWRLFTYVTVDIGVLWQLALMLKETNVQQRLRNAGGAIVMAVIMGIQSVVSVIYFFQSQTEMFADPLLHSFLYSLSRWAGGANMEKAEGLVRELMAVNKDYWNYPQLLDPTYIKKVGVPAAEPLLKQLVDVCQQPSGLDFIYKLVPTFTPDLHPQYTSMIDFMITNRWCFDYVTFCDRMQGGVGLSKGLPYPIAIPPLDIVWMVVGPLCFAACIFVHFKLKSTNPQPAAKPAPATAATT